MPWEVDSELCAVIKPLLPRVQGGASKPIPEPFSGHPVRTAHRDGLGAPVPQWLDFGSGMTCWCRLAAGSPPRSSSTVGVLLNAKRLVATADRRPTRRLERHALRQVLPPAQRHTGQSPLAFRRTVRGMPDW